MVMMRMIAFLALLSAFMALPGCTATQGQTAATVISAACQGTIIIADQPGLAPLCAAPGLVEKLVEEWNKSSTGMAAKRPMTNQELYERALAAGAKPIK